MLRRAWQPALARLHFAQLHSRSGLLLEEVTHVAAPTVSDKPKIAALPADVVPVETIAKPSAAVIETPPPPVPIPLPTLVRPSKTSTIPFTEAIKAVRQNARAKFSESVEICVQLGVDPKRSDQAVRGVASLPHGTGKKVRVAVFAEGAQAEEARRAGADVVGAEDLIAAVKAGGSSAIDFDKAIATPSMMPKLSAIARILGPRGLMPNPKLGTLTNDVPTAIAAVRQGQVQFRADRYALIHAPIGKVNFSDDALAENAAALIAALLAAKPKAVKAGKGAGAPGFLRWAKLTSTMGKGSVSVSLPSMTGAAVGMAAGGGIRQ